MSDSKPRLRGKEKIINDLNSRTRGKMIHLNTQRNLLFNQDKFYK